MRFFCIPEVRTMLVAMAPQARKSPGSVRIIAGEWRGRKLPVADLPGLRPTSDRSRETLFNWLQPALPGARCVDLYAGSGALGFEAASRGASHVDLVEIAPMAVSSLVETRSTLRAEQVTIHRDNALHWLSGLEGRTFDIAFVDPPFDSGLAIQTLVRLQELECIDAGGMVYVESPAKFPALVMQAPFEPWKDKVVGESRMQVFRRV